MTESTVTENTVAENVETQVARTTVQRTLKGLLYLYLVALLGFCVWQHRTLFAWPVGIVTGNLIASAICFPLALIHLDNVALRHHKEKMAQDRRHHLEHMALSRFHHKELKEHVENLCGPGESTTTAKV
jgi:hypothetical protein